MDRDFEIEEVVGADGRYVLYYRWPRDGTDEEADEPEESPTETDV